MLELGNDAVAMHKELAEMLKLHKIDLVFTAGELMKHLHDALPDAMRGAHAPTAEALLPLLRSALRPQDVVLAKGSHGSHIYQLSESLRASASLEN
jgi:UDP-N-acetylmuramoyl-tripeptide--D-alanyl-D-alanine ligase